MGDYEEDISKLRGKIKQRDCTLSYILLLNDINVDARINGNGFLSLSEGRLEQLGVSLGFLLPLVNIIRDLVCLQLIYFTIIFAPINLGL